MKDYDRTSSTPRGELADMFKLPKVLTVLARDGSGNPREVNYYHEEVLNMFAIRVNNNIREVRNTIASPKEAE